MLSEESLFLKLKKKKEKFILIFYQEKSFLFF